MKVFKKIQTGDEDLDRELCISTRSAGEALRYLSGANRRAALREVFHRRYLSIEINKRCTKFTKINCSLRDAEAENILWLLNNFTK